MAVAGGGYRLGPEAGQLLVKTSRTGLGAKAGHDLTIEVTRWRGTAVIDPVDPASCSVEVEADVESFEVRQGSGGVRPLTNADRAEIKKTIREKILHTQRYPTIGFRSTRVGGSAGSFTIDGDLTIRGVTQPVVLAGQLTDGGARGMATIVQSRWGIRPYSAFLGALRLKDEIDVLFDVVLTPNG